MRASCEAPRQAFPAQTQQGTIDSRQRNVQRISIQQRACQLQRPQVLGQGQFTSGCELPLPENLGALELASALLDTDPLNVPLPGINRSLLSLSRECLPGG